MQIANIDKGMKRVKISLYQIIVRGRAQQDRHKSLRFPVFWPVTILA